MNVGIDLGTTNTVVSYINEASEWKLLSFTNGILDKTMLPSCIYVDAGGTISIGSAALRERNNNSDNFLCDTKYDMGTEKMFYRAGKAFSAKDTATKILSEVMRELKDKFPEEEEFNAFVTVPARFERDARNETKQALIDAGFKVNQDRRSLADEPLAAAIAYSSELREASKIFVVDFGGGTFDLSIIETSAVGVMAGLRNLRVRGWGGELHLGGNDIDKLLIQKMLDKFVEDGGTLFDPWASYHETPEEQRAVAIICSLPLEIKKSLYSDSTQPACVYVDNLLGGKALDFEISLRDYENMMTDISLRYENCIKDTLKKGNYKFSDIDKVLIVGGMAHEPCLRKVLLSIFNDENKLVIPENSMYLVSKGAAIWNSNAELHVENKIYSSIGILLNNGTKVKTIVQEGSVIGDKGQKFKGELTLSDTSADEFRLVIVEFNGDFVSDPKCYRTIVSKVIPLCFNFGTSFSAKYLFRKAKQTITISVNLNADKIFTVTVKQPDGSKTDIALRLGE